MTLGIDRQRESA